ncbi:efflux RND transporter periplasmic adaptor subunit [Parahaliea mediterranea]|uniref:Efflux RND transporter periplasmic adaptor subunit n=1 Tax=Parahaliea mediterranea TaxID=651086 RepID=A0A939DJ14_9GAMM|nr:efflux RND transporter periplasmic adaptor subunit [Parahaliea mediterranea]MBN7798357.1 efflux RND transporter periplasmic adaptor subunit [Parahaliea mediterranea]
MPDSPPPQRPGGRRSTLAGVALAIALGALLTAVLRWRADASAPVARIEAMPVATVTFHEQSGYQQQRQFLGVVEAAQRADLAFESTGQIARIEVREGSRVEAGEVLARLDDRRLRAQRAAAAAEQETLQAELELARLKAQRQQDLQASGAVSREAYDETRLRAQALVAQGKAVAAELQRIDIELQKLQLRAPYGGIVAARYRDAGAVAGAGEPVLRLIQTGAREAHIGVAPEMAAALRAPQHHTLLWRDREVPATLRAVRPDVDPATRAAVAVFDLPEDLDALDGEAITLRLPRAIAEPGGWLPVSALLEGQRGVWNALAVRQRDGHSVTTREVVEVLALRSDQAYVRGTLRDGQVVVADGIHRIAPGSPVTPID